MKKMFFTVLAIAAMTSCSSENDSVESLGSTPVPVRMTGGIGNIAVGTKAAVNPNDAFAAQFAASVTIQPRFGARQLLSLLIPGR